MKRASPNPLPQPTAIIGHGDFTRFKSILKEFDGFFVENRLLDPTFSQAHKH
jgi:hypothetical protein